MHTREPSPAPGTRLPITGSDAERWLKAASHRRSRRAFAAPCPADALDALARLAERFRPFADARVVCLPEAPAELFTGLVGSYGRVTGATSALLFVGRGDDEGRDDHVGATGEAAVLEATALGVDTCWIGGAFDRSLATKLPGILADETVLAITPLGIAEASMGLGERSMRAMAGAHRRKPLDRLAPGIGDAWPAWARSAVDAARVAPSAVNRQPWRFAIEDGSLVVRATGIETPAVSRRLDCGIAMLHATLGALSCGVDGSWTDLPGDDVARFTPEDDTE